jgi:hypothetical protein
MVATRPEGLCNNLVTGYRPSVYLRGAAGDGANAYDATSYTSLGGRALAAADSAPPGEPGPW